MNTNQRSEIMDSIARAGDAAVLKFGGYCMRILEDGGEVTIEDAQEFLEGLS